MHHLVGFLVGSSLDDALEASRLDARRIDRAQPHVAVHLFAQRIEDTARDDLHTEDVLGDLRRHDVAVVTAGGADECVRLIETNAPQHVDIDAVADHTNPVEVVR